MKVEVGKEYLTRGGFTGFVYEDSGHSIFPFKVRYSDGTEDTVTADGRHSNGQVGPKDLVSLADEGSRLYAFFKKPHSGELSSKWKEYED